jgi:cold shock protein
MGQQRGNVVWFSSAMGFGFIKRDSDPDVFFHRGALQVMDRERLHDGDEVEFDTTGPQGLQADNVALIRSL